MVLTFLQHVWSAANWVQIQYLKKIGYILLEFNLQSVKSSDVYFWLLPWQMRLRTLFCCFYRRYCCYLMRICVIFAFVSVDALHTLWRYLVLPSPSFVLQVFLRRVRWLQGLFDDSRPGWTRGQAPEPVGAFAEGNDVPVVKSDRCGCRPDVWTAALFPGGRSLRFPPGGSCGSRRVLLLRTL